MMQQLKNFGLLITFFIATFSLHAQKGSENSLVDSLKMELTKEGIHDTTYLNLMYQVGEETPIYRFSYWDSIVKYAEKSMEKKINEAEKFAIRGVLASSLNNLGYVSNNTGNTSEAIKYYLQSLGIEKELNNKEGISTAMNNVGFAYHIKGDLNVAFSYYFPALKIHKEINDIEGEAMSYINIGTVYQDLGDLERSIDYTLKALEIYKRVQYQFGIATSLNNLGLMYMDVGNFPKAIEKYTESILILRALNAAKYIPKSLNNIALIYSEQGNYEDAIKIYEESISLLKKLEDKLSLGITYGNLGSAYGKQKSFEKSLDYQKKSLKIREEIGNKSGIALSLNNIGSVYSKLNDLTKAMNYYRKAFDISNEVAEKRRIITASINIGSVYLMKRDSIEKAEFYVKNAYRMSKELGFIERVKSSAALLYEVNVTKGNNSIKEGELDKAEMFFAKADSFTLEVVDINNEAILLNFTALSEKNQEKYFKKVAGNYKGFNSYALIRKEKKPEIVDVVYNNTIKNKGLLLKSSTAMRNAILNSDDSLLINNYYDWILLKKRITKMHGKGQDTKALEQKSNELEKELVKKSQLFSNFKNGQNINWKTIQMSLKPNEVAIEFIHFKYIDYKTDAYFKFSDTVLYCALIITPSSKSPQMIPLFEESKLEAILGKFGGNNNRYINDVYGTNSKVKMELYDLIWKPIEQSLKGVKKVYLSPDGLLHKVSFSAIAKKQNVYLSDQFTIEIKSSTGKIVQENMDWGSRNRPMNTATIFGGIQYDTDSTVNQVWSYLKGTKVEADKINLILQNEKLEVIYLNNSNATEGEFKRLASNSNILHMATHGFFYPDPKELLENEEVEYGDVSFRGGSRGQTGSSFVKSSNPLMRSGLVFAGANDVWSTERQDHLEDGVLTAQEVAHIDMRKTNLVVMSACETGLGDIKGSEGVYGLQRAFKMAGVHYMIMSLWQVPDKETEEFMTSFYGRLLELKDIKQAFDLTQKEMRKKYDPYYWAAFILIE